jgi:hypothetical protein
LKVLFDQNVPRPLARHLISHSVKLAKQIGLSDAKNGELLDAAEAAGFDVLLSGDRTIFYEQNMTGRKIALVYMSDNHWPIVKHYVPDIVQAVEQSKPGEIRPVYCGTFAPRKRQKRDRSF